MEAGHSSYVYAYKVTKFEFNWQYRFSFWKSKIVCKRTKKKYGMYRLLPVVEDNIGQSPSFSKSIKASLKVP